MKKPTLSFEFFPPKTYQAWDTLVRQTAVTLAMIKPAFMTVTYGAGGSRRSWTMETAIAIQTNTGVPTAAHLTCINVYKKALLGIADTFWDNGIRHIVALRGDIPPEDAPLEYDNQNYYHYASQLIEGIRTVHDFEISVAAYPEKHPDAPDLETDIANLKRKCDLGVTRAITQFFFDNDVYFRFLEKTQAAGITTPIVPGVMPIQDFEKVLKFSAVCGTNVPAWLRARFEKLEKPADRRKAALEILVKQMETLADAGAPHLHIYALNKADLPLEACKDAGLGV